MAGGGDKTLDTGSIDSLEELCEIETAGVETGLIVTTGVVGGFNPGGWMEIGVI